MEQEQTQEQRDAQSASADSFWHAAQPATAESDANAIQIDTLVGVKQEAEYNRPPPPPLSDCSSTSAFNQQIMQSEFESVSVAEPQWHVDQSGSESGNALAAHSELSPLNVHSINADSDLNGDNSPKHSPDNTETLDGSEFKLDSLVASGKCNAVNNPFSDFLPNNTGLDLAIASNTASNNESESPDLNTRTESNALDVSTHNPMDFAGEIKANNDLLFGTDDAFASVLSENSAFPHKNPNAHPIASATDEVETPLDNQLNSNSVSAQDADNVQPCTIAESEHQQERIEETINNHLAEGKREEEEGGEADDDDRRSCSSMIVHDTKAVEEAVDQTQTTHNPSNSCDVDSNSWQRESFAPDENHLHKHNGEFTQAAEPADSHEQHESVAVTAESHDADSHLTDINSRGADVEITPIQTLIPTPQSDETGRADLECAGERMDERLSHQLEAESADLLSDTMPAGSDACVQLTQAEDATHLPAACSPHAAQHEQHEQEQEQEHEHDHEYDSTTAATSTVTATTTDANEKENEERNDTQVDSHLHSHGDETIKKHDADAAGDSESLEMNGVEIQHDNQIDRGHCEGNGEHSLFPTLKTDFSERSDLHDSEAGLLAHMHRPETDSEKCADSEAGRLLSGLHHIADGHKLEQHHEIESINKNDANMREDENAGASPYRFVEQSQVRGDDDVEAHNGVLHQAPELIDFSDDSQKEKAHGVSHLTETAQPEAHEVALHFDTDGKQSGNTLSQAVADPLVDSKHIEVSQPDLLQYEPKPEPEVPSPSSQESSNTNRKFVDPVPSESAPAPPLHDASEFNGHQDDLLVARRLSHSTVNNESVAHELPVHFDSETPQENAEQSTEKDPLTDSREVSIDQADVRKFENSASNSAPETNQVNGELPAAATAAADVPAETTADANANAGAAVAAVGNADKVLSESPKPKTDTVANAAKAAAPKADAKSTPAKAAALKTAPAKTNSPASKKPDAISSDAKKTEKAPSTAVSAVKKAAEKPASSPSKTVAAPKPATKSTAAPASKPVSASAVPKAASTTNGHSSASSKPASASNGHPNGAAPAAKPPTSVASTAKSTTSAQPKTTTAAAKPKEPVKAPVRNTSPSKAVAEKKPATTAAAEKRPTTASASSAAPKAASSVSKTTSATTKPASAGAKPSTTKPAVTATTRATSSATTQKAK